MKHKLDGSEYAVKKIPIRSEGIESVKSYLSEVKTFASLNHSNIVQYKAAWLELGAPKMDKAITDNVSGTSFTGDNSLPDHRKTAKWKDPNDNNNCAYPFDTSEHTFSLRKQGSTSDFEVNFESGGSFARERHYSYSNNNIISAEPESRRQKRNSISEGGDVVCTAIDIQEMRHLNRIAQTKWATLYIQMALCQSTLKQWLEKRNVAGGDVRSVLEGTALMPVSGVVREETVVEILRQLLRGILMVTACDWKTRDNRPLTYLAL